MKKIITTILVLTGIGHLAIAQEKSTSEMRADKYTFNYSYSKAIDSYTSAKNLTLRGQCNLAESYHKMGQNRSADSVYAIVMATPGTLLPEDHFNYAMVLKANSKYAESDKQMQIFASLKPSDLRAKDFLMHQNDLKKIQVDQGNYKVASVNTNTSSTDFGTVYYQNKIVFASSRKGSVAVIKEDPWTHQPYLALYVSELDGRQLKSPTLLNKGFTGKMHDGPASFSKNGLKMAFTSNNYDDKSKDRVVELQIHFSSFENNEWTDPTAFVFNNSGYSVGHPCLSADGKTMYFVSDMPGGFGKSDIYITTLNVNGEWTRPINLGDQINTESDELFPFYEEKNNKLYFSSNGRYGLGGLDIFIADLKDGMVSNVHNAGYPLNTNFDDFAAIVDSNLKYGYFSTNRNGGIGNDDIFMLEMVTEKDKLKRIEGIAMTKEGIAVPNTFVTLFDNNFKLIDTVTTNKNGFFSFEVQPDEQFNLLGKKELYYDGKNTANTSGKEFIIKANLELLKSYKSDVDTSLRKKDLAVILNLKPIYFDLNKYNINSDAANELDKIAAIMNENPDMVVSLNAHTDCRASESYNQTLSDKRANATVSYIRKRISTPNRITGKGYGETKPINGCVCEGNTQSDCSDYDFQMDRRIEFIILNKDVVFGK
jgi:outer membrane protein OmpA-like peptidoglycan-associated protein